MISVTFVGKLTDSLYCLYEDALSDDYVFEQFRIVSKKLKQVLKGEESSMMVDDYLKKLENSRKRLLGVKSVLVNSKLQRNRNPNGVDVKEQV